MPIMSFLTTSLSQYWEDYLIRLFYNIKIKTHLGKEFLKIICTTFPPNQRLFKVCNRNTIKLSCSCLPNMKAVVYEAKIMRNDNGHVETDCGWVIDLCEATSHLPPHVVHLGRTVQRKCDVDIVWPVSTKYISPNISLKPITHFSAAQPWLVELSSRPPSLTRLTSSLAVPVRYTRE